MTSTSTTLAVLPTSTAASTAPPTVFQRQTLLSSRFQIPSKTELTKVTKGITNLLASTGTPYSFVELDAFQKFMAIVCPHYKVPCRTTFSERFIPQLYSETRETIAMMIRDVPFMSLTTDGWTGCNGSQFVAVTTTYITDDWTMQTVTLACREFNKSHTGKHIAALIRDILGEYNINERRVSAITTDRGSNMINAVVKELLMPHVPCFAHALNTFVQKVLQNHFVSAILEKVRSLYNLFSQSSHARRVLKEMQKNNNLPTNKMPSSCTTRWWSEIQQLQFVVVQEKALFSFCNEFKNGEHQNYAITSNDMKNVNVVLGFMVDLERIQKTLGGEKEATGSLIHPVIDKTNDIINKIGNKCLAYPGVYTFRQDVQQLFQALKDLYATESSHLDMATFMDPRFERKNVSVITPIIELDARINVGAPSAAESSEIHQQKPRNDLQIFFDDEDEDMPAAVRTIESDIEEFLRKPKLSLAEDAILWWKRNQSNFPLLAQIAKKYLCITATSVPSERVFSVGGNILTKGRYNLSDEHVEQLIFLTKNKNLIQW